MRMAFSSYAWRRRVSKSHRPEWIHEMKHDGYRTPVVRENERVRLIFRDGTDRTKR